MVLNLPSYAGGSDLWGRGPPSRWREQTVDDGVLEVVAIDSTAHMGLIKSGLGSVHRIAQVNFLFVRE